MQFISKPIDTPFRYCDDHDVFLMRASLSCGVVTVSFFFSLSLE